MRNTRPRCRIQFFLDIDVVNDLTKLAEEYGLTPDAMARHIIAEHFGYDPETVIGRDRVPRKHAAQVLPG